MQRTKLFELLFMSAFLFGGLNVYAQPESIDVKSLSLRHDRSSRTLFSMRAVDSSKTEIVYAGDGGYSLPVFLCIPCRLPNSFASDSFREAFNFAWGFDKRVNFFVSNVKSDPIILRPTIRRKPRFFNVGGAKEISGRVEVRDEKGIVVAVDNDVVLKGDYTVRFLNNNLLDGRRVEFVEFNYLLTQPAN